MLHSCSSKCSDTCFHRRVELWVVLSSLPGSLSFTLTIDFSVLQGEMFSKIVKKIKHWCKDKKHCTNDYCCLLDYMPKLFQGIVLKCLYFYSVISWVSCVLYKSIQNVSFLRTLLDRPQAIYYNVYSILSSEHHNFSFVHRHSVYMISFLCYWT